MLTPPPRFELCRPGCGPWRHVSRGCRLRRFPHVAATRATGGIRSTSRMLQPHTPVGCRRRSLTTRSALHARPRSRPRCRRCTAPLLSAKVEPRYWFAPSDPRPQPCLTGRRGRHRPTRRAPMRPVGSATATINAMPGLRRRRWGRRWIPSSVGPGTIPSTAKKEDEHPVLNAGQFQTVADAQAETRRRRARRLAGKIVPMKRALARAFKGS